jgi:uncharacterized protein YhaN
VRLLDLHLQAYGPFTDRHLDLSGGREGLHVVFGPNEAGKSSALRALRALLYGIPERTQDDFIHSKSALRIGGRFCSRTGEEWVCYRRKGRKHTLLDRNGSPLPEDTLMRLLGGVDERLFQRLFGIDHEALVTGGEALLEERGREAEALFGTGLGSNAVHAVLEQLDQEAQSLFAPRASKPLINARLSQLAEIERQRRQRSLSARQWDEARRAADSARRELDAIDQELARISKQRSTLERIRRTLPGLAKRAQFRARLGQMGTPLSLAEDFGERREAAMVKRRSAVERRVQAQARIEDLRTKAASLEVSEPLLGAADVIDELREALGSHRKANRDLPGLEAKRAAQQEQARRRLLALRPGLEWSEIDHLRPLLNRRRQATELGARQQVVEAAVSRANDQLTETGQKLTSMRRDRAEVPKTPSLELLQSALEAARRAGDLDSAIDDVDARFRRHEAACVRDLTALGLWQGSLSGLLSAPLPMEETARRFGEAMRALEEADAKAEELRSAAKAEQRHTQETLRALELAGEVPSEDALERARAHRNQGWRLLWRQWIARDEITAEAQAFGAGKPLHEAFEQAMMAADELADRLRREAQRVHQKASAQAKSEQSEQQLDVAEAELKAVRERRHRLELDWAQRWQGVGIKPLAPQEMAAWSSKVARLRDKSEQGDELRQQQDSLRMTRNQHRAHLCHALDSAEDAVPGGPEHQALGTLLDRAEARLRALEANDARRQRLDEEIAELEAQARRADIEARNAEAARATWRLEWSELMRVLGLEPDQRPGEVSDYLQSLAEVVHLVDEATDLEHRIAAIKADARQFHKDATEVLLRVAPDLAERPKEEAVVQLHARVAQHKAAQSRWHELQAQERQAEEVVRGSEAAILAADEVLTELCAQAECAMPEALEGAEQRWHEHRRLVAELQAVEEELLAGGDGLSIDALEAEAVAADRDAVITELAAVIHRIDDELTPKRAELLEKKVNAERDFAAMTGGDEASVLAEQAQQTLSELRGLGEHFVRVKLAQRILRDEIECFRRQHRDPILVRARQYFEQLTCGSFTAIETDFDEWDQPVLVGVRPNSARLRVEAMSAGTRDQLYLALRLATLDHYRDRSEALPFIVDDILIQFDDDRARATLGALATFSTRTQVILFTHHGRIVDQAHRLDGAQEQVFVHDLG